MAQRGSDQFRVEVLGDFLQLVTGKTKNKTIVVVVRYSALRRVASPRFHHDVVPFCNQPMRRRSDSAVDSGAQWTEQFQQDGLLPLICP